MQNIELNLALSKNKINITAPTAIHTAAATGVVVVVVVVCSILEIGILLNWNLNLRP
jgi:hypothetical protein